MSEIGRRVRHLRKERGLTQDQVAASSGIAQSTLALIESGKRIPNSTSVTKLAAGLGIGVGDLYPRGQASLPSPAAMDMEATLRAIRENAAMLEAYFDSPPDETTADEAINRFYDLVPKPLEHLSLMEPDEMRQYIEAVKEAHEIQTRIGRQLGPWNVAQYGHLHKNHAWAATK